MTYLFLILIQEGKAKTILLRQSQWTQIMIVASMLPAPIRFCLSATFYTEAQLRTEVRCILESAATLLGVIAAVGHPFNRSSS
jgi:hypothetical protein